MGAKQSTAYTEFKKQTRSTSAKASVTFFITSLVGAVFSRFLFSESTLIMGVPSSVIYFSILLGIFHYIVSVVVNLFATKYVCKRVNGNAVFTSAIAPSITTLVVGIASFILMVVPIPVWKNIMMVINTTLGENIVFLVAGVISIFAYFTSMIAITASINKTCEPK
jgi:hypothetical protein